MQKADLNGILVDILPLNQVLQLNEYETAPYFLQLSQNMTSDCLFTFVFSPFLPEFTCFAQKKNFF